VAFSDDSFEHLGDLLAGRQWQELRTAVSRMDPADLADFIEGIDSDDRDVVFSMLDIETASDVLVELQPSAIDDVVEDLPSEHIADLAEQMEPDEAVEFLTDLDDEQSEEVLAAMEPDKRDEVNDLLRYEEDSAGRIMTPEILSYPSSTSVQEARVALATVELSDPVLNIYVIDPATNALVGTVLLTDLFAAPPPTALGDIADREYIFATPDEDQQEIARKFRKYDLWVMPIVDDAHRLVGRITVDDVIDVVHEEADEDLAHMIGAPDIEEEEESLVRIARLRLPWLLITMCGGLLNSVIIKHMLQTTEVVAIAIFVPAILAMGGNTGMQSSAVCIRGIALGEKRYGRLGGTMWREIRVGLCLGVVCGLAAGVLVCSVLTLTAADTGGIAPGRLSMVVGGAMFSAMVFASCYGAVVPVLLHRLDIDPAVASGPFITTSNDLSASLIYFLTCLVLLKGAA